MNSKETKKTNNNPTLLNYYSPTMSKNKQSSSEKDNSTSDIAAKKIRKATKKTEPKKHSLEKRIVPLVELNSESSNDAEDSVKCLIEKNISKNIPEVFVQNLSPQTLNLLTKRPNSVRKIECVDIADDSSDDEPIAKKVSPSSACSYSSNGENKKSFVNKEKSAKKCENSPKKRQNYADLNSTKRKLLQLKKNVTKSPSSTKMNKIFSSVIGTSKNFDPKPKKVQKTNSSTSDAEDTLPLAKFGKILSSAADNDSQKSVSKSEEGKNNAKSPSKFLSPSKMQENRRKSVISRLERLKKMASEKPSKPNIRAYRELAQFVIAQSVLNSDQINLINNEDVKKDLNFRLGREKLKKMTEEEKKEHYRQKDIEKRKIDRERFEDSEISNSTLLPDPKPVETPRELPKSSYGDILMIVEFLRTFSELFKCEKKFKVDLETFIKALTSGSHRFEYLGKIFVFLVEILLEEKCPVELNTKLDEIEINVYTVSELIRLLLCPKNDSKDDRDDETESNFSFSDKLEENICSELENFDFFHSSAQNLLEILSLLIHNVLQTQTFDDFLKKKEDELAAAWRDRASAYTDLKQYKTENEPKIDESKEKTQEKPAETSNSLSIAHFYGNSAGNFESNENNDVNSNEPADDMIYKVKNRRLLAAREREKEKEERAKLRKEQELAAKQDKIGIVNRKLEHLQKVVKSCFRREPLGKDRNHNRYWFFPNVSPFLYVEKGWTCPQSNTVLGSPKKFPTCESNAWFYLDTVDGIDKLISALIPKGIRESNLKEVLTKLRPEIESSFEDFAKKPADDLEGADAELSLKEFLREDIYSVECKIREGGLGGAQDFDDWQSRLNNASELNEFADLVTETQHNVRPSLLSGMMSVKKSVVQAWRDIEEAEQVLSEEEQKSQEEAMRTKRIENWKLAVNQCKTWSRLIVLFNMFKNCIMWERSIENSRCNKCHKNKDDDKVILCEVCNAGYHIYCLRPPLKKIPAEEWFCFQCQPPAARTRARFRKEMEESNSEHEPEHDEVCSRCNEGPEDDDDELVCCSTCPNTFHKACHEPPLRHAPRVGWRCCQCTKGILIKRNLRKRKLK